MATYDVAFTQDDIQDHNVIVTIADQAGNTNTTTWDFNIYIPPECSDGIDNDGDGFCDFFGLPCKDGSTPGDKGCDNQADDDETDYVCGSENGGIAEQCCDGQDNEAQPDELIDYGQDPDCNSLKDDNEEDMVIPVCGDNILNQMSEDCDVQSLRGHTCQDFGCEGGEISCTDGCEFDISQCSGCITDPPTPYCGDNIKNSDFEECDGSDLTSKTCAAFNADLYVGPGLGCTSDCRFDFTGCQLIQDQELSCNDGIINRIEEICDLTDLAGVTCQDLNFLQGTLQCNNLCNGYDLTQCSLAPICGDNVLNRDQEECDGTDFGEEDCSVYGFDTGELTCRAGCTLDTAQCNQAQPACNDGVINSIDEDCDTDDLNRLTCEDFGCQGQGLSCTDTCDFDISLCTDCSTQQCQNDQLDPGEECDTSQLDDQTCQDFDDYNGGILGCTSDCQFDFTQCTSQTGPVCGDGVINQFFETCDQEDIKDTCQSLGYVSGDLACSPGCTSYILTGCVQETYCGDGILNNQEECDNQDIGTTSCASLGFDTGDIGCKADCTFDKAACIPFAACKDGSDNDLDGLLDYGFTYLENDPGCDNKWDQSEDDLLKPPQISSMTINSNTFSSGDHLDTTTLTINVDYETDVEISSVLISNEGIGEISLAANKVTNNSYSIPATLSQGTFDLSITATNYVGQTTNTFVLTIDTTDPQIDINDELDTKRSNTNILVTGTYNERYPKSIDVYGQGVDYMQDGNFEKTIQLDAGTTPILAEIQDLAGNTASDTTSIEVLTNQARLAAQLTPILTSTGDITIVGTADIGSTIIILLNNEQIDEQTLTTTIFSSQLKIIKQGTNALRIEVIDEYERTNHTTLYANLDTQGPVVVTSQPQSEEQGLFDEIQIEVSDQTGIDPSSIELKFGAAQTVVVPHTYSEGIITYDISNTIDNQEYTIELSLSDTLGNPSNIGPITFTMNRLAPHITLIEPLNGYATTLTPDFIVEIDDYDSKQAPTLSISGDTFNLIPYPGLIYRLPSGHQELITNSEYEFRMVATKNNVDTVFIEKIFVDSHVPEISIGNLPTTTKENSIIIFGTFTEPNLDNIIVTIGEETIVATTIDNTFTATLPLPQGQIDEQVSIIVDITDLTGQSASQSTAIRVDRIMPTISFVNEVGTIGNTGDTYDINLQLQGEPGATVNIQEIGNVGVFDQEGQLLYQYTITQSGTNTIIATTTDLAGNSNSAELSVYYDNTKPTITNIQPSTISSNTQPTITATIADHSILNQVKLSLNPVGQGPVQVFSIAPEDTTYDLAYQASLDDGDYLITVEATDQFQNLHTVTQQFTLDSTVPTIPTFNLDDPQDPADHYTTQTSPELIFAFSEPVIVEPLEGIIATFVSPEPYIYSTNNLADGTYNIIIKAKLLDGTGVVGAYPFTLVLDTQDPIITLNPLVDVTSQDLILVSGTCLDQTELNIIFSGDAVATPTTCIEGTWEATIDLSDGDETKTVTVTATDKTDHTDTAQDTIIKSGGAPGVFIDSVIVAPSDILSGPPYKTNATTITLNGHYVDNSFGGIEVKLDNETIQAIPIIDGTNFTVQIPINSQSGIEVSNLITIVVTDGAGMQGEGSVTVINDNQAPEITDFTPQSTTDNTPDIAITTDEPAQCSVTYLDSSSQEVTIGFVSSQLAHTVTLTPGLSDDETIKTGVVTQLSMSCTDDFGNLVTTDHTISIDNNNPQIGEVSLSNSNSVLLLSDLELQEYIVFGDNPLTTISIGADEPVICKYSTIADNYNEMENPFGTQYQSGQTTPSIQLNDSLNTYYISCQDQAGNIAPTWTINMNYNLAYQVPITQLTKSHVNTQDPLLSVSTSVIPATCQVNFAGADEWYTMQQTITNNQHTHTIQTSDTNARLLSEQPEAHVFTITCSAPPGFNIDDSSIELSVVVDLTAPVDQPVLNDMPSAININRVNVSGIAQLTNTLVMIFVGGTNVANTTTSTIAINPRFNATDIPLKPGNNTITARLVDAAGNLGPLSDPKWVVYAKEGPEVFDAIPGDGAVLNNLSAIEVLFELYSNTRLSIGDTWVNLTDQNNVQIQTTKETPVFTPEESEFLTGFDIIHFNLTDGLANGQYKAVIYPVDILGNLGTPFTINFVIDNRVPAIDVSIEPNPLDIGANAVITTETIIITAIANSNNQDVPITSLSLDIYDTNVNQITQTRTAIATSPTAQEAFIITLEQDGQYQAVLTATTAAGIPATLPKTFTIDTLGPKGCINIGSEVECK